MQVLEEITTTKTYRVHISYVDLWSWLYATHQVRVGSGCPVTSPSSATGEPSEREALDTGLVEHRGRDSPSGGDGGGAGIGGPLICGVSLIDHSFSQSWGICTTLHQKAKWFFWENPGLEPVPHCVFVVYCCWSDSMHVYKLCKTVRKKGACGRVFMHVDSTYKYTKEAPTGQQTQPVLLLHN